MATAEFSKFAGILSAALSQHHLLGFELLKIGLEIAQALLALIKFEDSDWTTLASE